MCNGKENEVVFIPAEVIHREACKDRVLREAVAGNCAWVHNFVVASDEDSCEDRLEALIAACVAMLAAGFEFYDSVVLP